MTPGERKLLEELFERLEALEDQERDPEACDIINAGLERAPNAVYPLVQSVLVQDEALKRADARIRNLEAQLGLNPEQSTEQPASFLDSMRDRLTGRREPRGSVPAVKPPVWGASTAAPPAETQYAPGPGAPSQPAGPGGSFLGTAATAAAGAIGGALLLNGIRSMLGGQQHQTFGGTNPGGPGSPWSPSPGPGGGDLAREAGLDDIGGSRRTAAYDDPANAERASLFDTAQNDGGDFDSSDFSTDHDFGGDESDTA